MLLKVREMTETLSSIIFYFPTGLILIEKFHLLFSKLPIMTDIAAIDTDLPQFVFPLFSMIFPPLRELLWFDR